MNYDQLWGFLAGNATMLGVVSVVYTLSKAKNIIFHNPEPKTQPLPVNIAKPDIMVVAQLYADGSATIDAKDYMGTPYPIRMQKYATHTTLNALNFFFESTPEVEKEAVREATTVLEPVAVDVEHEEALDVIQPMLNGGDQFGNLVKGIKKGKGGDAKTS